MSATYKQRGVKGHPNAAANGTITEHVLLASLAIGKPLPTGAEVHHVDGNRRNNAPSNLVICQDSAYHSLLHARQRVRDAGGNPNTERMCSTCRRVKPFADFNRASRAKAYGLQSRCRACQSALFRVWKANRVRRQHVSGEETS